MGFTSGGARSGPPVGECAGERAGQSRPQVLESRATCERAGPQVLEMKKSMWKQVAQELPSDSWDQEQNVRGQGAQSRPLGS